MKTLVRPVLNIALGLCAIACASVPKADPEARHATQTEQPARKSSPVPVPSAQPTPASDRVATAEATPVIEPDPRADGLRKASRPPLELITNPSVLYVFNFSESAAGQSAKERCDESSDGAPDQLAACLQKARSKVPVESARFIKKGKDEYWWVTLNRYRGNLLKWHVIQFQVGEETNDRVVLKPMGKDKGIAPMTNIPRSLEIDLPNDYSIVLNDPEFGKMVFEAKFGKIDDG
jgi:hypothetical protein